MLQTILKTTVIGLKLVDGIEGEEGKEVMAKVLKKMKKYAELRLFVYVAEQIFVKESTVLKVVNLKLLGNGCRKVMKKWKKIFISSSSHLFPNSKSLKLRMMLLSYRFSLLCEILYFFKSDYLEEIKKEGKDFEEEMKRMEKVCLDFFIVCSFFDSFCHYDIYILEFPKIARILFEMGLTLEVFFY
jgi:hypothetical protein